MKTTKQIFWEFCKLSSRIYYDTTVSDTASLLHTLWLSCIEGVLCADKQQEVDINNLRLEEEFSAGKARAGGGAGGGAARGAVQGAPLSTISGVKKPLGHTNR